MCNNDSNKTTPLCVYVMFFFVDIYVHAVITIYSGLYNNYQKKKRIYIYNAIY